MYYTKENNELKLINEQTMQVYGYYMAGYQDPNDAGKLSVLQNIDGGTCLVFVYNSKGEQVCQLQHAGKYFKETI